MTTSRPRLRRRQIGLLAVQYAAILVASLLLILGVLGFVPGVTANLDALHLAGPQSNAALFGIFDVSILDNLLQVAVGVMGLLMATTFARARAFLVLGGLLYLGLWIHGLLINFDSPTNVLPVNQADNWLHLGFGVAMVLLALTLAGTRVPTGARGEVLLPPE
jgi:Domain of unknown function (DUF4383)